MLGVPESDGEDVTPRLTHPYDRVMAASTVEEATEIMEALSREEMLAYFRHPKCARWLRAMLKHPKTRLDYMDNMLRALGMRPYVRRNLL